MQFYTVSEVAKILRVRKTLVYEMVYSGRIKAIQLSKRRIRIAESSISEFIEKESCRNSGDSISA
ncbi:DNA binding domain protein, excisionase family [Desulfofarcimen acetoxidans DSM 771]|uniref:DNA binding domain protein, excisionase family n=1 Tax=Desulfofarcimen acetoxidans (strain ATCC 49208 / DSM 771 / KCTC 5769 / VKM B-1644 / 5575) TaxID=485916 RepID=C8VVK5_DESAS|nr:helix-turn-helix domain-containing protein [Desulfofarcimen acetoxidans]ACV62320.1 DNA binding domain protein, excisionase family [Desulfofarcimen acetoxidans DSM 771]